MEYVSTEFSTKTKSQPYQHNETIKFPQKNPQYKKKHVKKNIKKSQTQFTKFLKGFYVFFIISNSYQFQFILYLNSFPDNGNWKKK